MLEKVILKFVGEDYWSRPVFEIQGKGIYVKDVNCGESDTLSLFWSCPKDDPGGEPDYPFEMDAQIEIIDYYPTSPKDKEKYMLLSRLQSDCEYYLGFGGRSTNRLWAGNEKSQIEKMKEIYDSFPVDKRPEWLTREKIEEYEREMCIGKIEEV